MALLDIIVIALYFAIVIGAGVYFSKKASRDLRSYFLGDKQMHWLLLAMSGAVSNFDVTGTMWMVSVLYLLGMKSWWHHWMWGVMLPAFGLAYMAKWVRKSGVITGAEWMKTRFGEDGGGRAARAMYAVMAVITCVSFIGYDFQGIGKFAAVYIPLELMADWSPLIKPLVTTYEPETLALLVLGVTTLYVIMGGLFGVVITDVIQTVILTMAAILIAGIAFVKVSPEAAARVVPVDFASWLPAWRIPEFHGTANASYEMFGLLTIVWIVKGLFLNAGGPGQLYDFQRYLAARSPKDASKLAAAWPFFLVVRWAMVAAIVMLALGGVGEVTDPEMVMPAVLREYLPAGLKGLVIAGLLAAFMSTFSSTANSGASYIIKDVWQPLFGRGQQDKGLIRMSYLATAGIVIAGMVVGWFAESIASIWGWIMMALGGAVIAPNLLRWYWWRINGWGYAAGMAAGIVLSILPLARPDLPVYVTFPVICAGSLLGAAAVSLITAPTDREVLKKFYSEVAPFGLWGEIAKIAETPKDPQAGCAFFPVFNTMLAIVGITGLYLAPMYLVGHWYPQALAWASVSAITAAILYYTWYKRLGED
jgi:Na+/proline symporter